MQYLSSIITIIRCMSSHVPLRVALRCTAHALTTARIDVWLKLCSQYVKSTSSQLVHKLTEAAREPACPSWLNDDLLNTLGSLHFQCRLPACQGAWFPSSQDFVQCTGCWSSVCSTYQRSGSCQGCCSCCDRFISARRHLRHMAAAKL